MGVLTTKERGAWNILEAACDCGSGFLQATKTMVYMGHFLVLEKKTKTYNTTDSLVVTDPTTSAAVRGLSRGERTGSRVVHCIWSYVMAERTNSHYKGRIGRNHWT